jgi:hypothetical protein
VLGVGFAITHVKPDGHDIALSLFALGAAVYPVLVAYRFLLFFVTLNTM